jgi:hypothetical protein
MLFAGPAQAATVTVGSPLSGTITNRIGAIASTQVTSALPAPNVAASPVDGTVISWRFVGGGPLIPRVIRPLGGGLYTGAGSGAAQVGPGFNQVSGPLPVSLLIRKGDLFGIDVAVNSTFATHADPAAVWIGWLTPQLADGGAGRAPNDGPNAEEVMVQAVVRYCLVPKVKGKTPKKAKKALRAADCTVGKTRKSKKTASKKKVVKQSVKPGTSISDTEPINLKVSRTD